MGVRAHEDALVFKALEHSLERERLEVMERQVAVAEDALVAQEVMARKEFDDKVAKVRKTLTDEYHEKLKRQESRFLARCNEMKGEADNFKEKLAAVECRK